MSAVRTLHARCVGTVCAPRAAVSTPQQLLAPCKSVIAAARTLWERRVDAVLSLFGVTGALKTYTGRLFRFRHNE